MAQAAKGLAKGELRLPRHRKTVKVPMTKLADLGKRGLYHMDISGTEIASSDLPRGPFDIVPPSGGTDTWPVLWGHDAKKETRLVIAPDQQGHVRPGCDDKAAQAWERTASRLHFNRDFQVNSQPLTACITPEPTIGGRAWPNFLVTDARWEAPLVLWANTTLGLLAFWWIGTRQQQGRAILPISKLPELVTLDVRQLSDAQLDRAEALFEQFNEREFLPANEAYRDKTRKALDRAMLVDLLGLPKDLGQSLKLLRRQWCEEPSVHGGKKTAPGQSS